MQEMMANVINCHSHAKSTARPRMPTIAAARPNQMKCTPGTIVSSTNSATATMNQFQGPRLAKKSVNGMSNSATHLAS